MVNLGSRQIFLASLYAVYFVARTQSNQDDVTISVSPEKMLHVCSSVRKERGYVGWLDKATILKTACGFHWVSEAKDILCINTKDELDMYGSVVSNVHANVLNGFIKIAKESYQETPISDSVIH